MFSAMAVATSTHDLLRVGRPLALGELAVAAEHLFDEMNLLLMACRVLSAVRPDCISQIYTLAGLGGRMVGGLVRMVDGQAVPDDGAFRRLYSQGFQPLDRASAEAGGWIEAVKDGLWTQGQLERVMLRQPSLGGRRSREYGCAAIVAGSRTVASFGLAFPGDAPPLSSTDRTTLAEVLQSVAPVVRAASLLKEAETGLHAVDHLLAARADTVFLVSQKGHLVGASAGGHNLLERCPGLRDVIEKGVRSNPRRSVSFLAAGVGLELHISPCSTTGGSPVSIVSVGSPLASARRRISRRQAELLRWLAEGLTNREIALRMGLASSTVKTMLEHLYRRAGTSGRVKLLRWAQADPVSRQDEIDDELTGRIDRLVAAG
jgi:DNA-binding CsgD family transcriptional regulator